MSEILPALAAAFRRSGRVCAGLGPPFLDGRINPARWTHEDDETVIGKLRRARHRPLDRRDAPDFFIYAGRPLAGRGCRVTESRRTALSKWCTPYAKRTADNWRSVYAVAYCGDLVSVASLDPVAVQY